MHISYNKENRRLTLWERYVAGDRAAFGELYTHFHRSLTAYCVGKVGSVEAAENVASETLVKLLQHPRPYEIDNFESWLFTVAKNVCFTQLSKSKRRNELLRQRINPADGHAPEVEQKLSMENIDQIIRNHLDDRDYKIWLLHQQGYDNQEIAEIIGSTEKTVANRKSSARTTLKKILKELNGN